MRNMFQETEILDFLKDNISLIPKQLYCIRYVFKREDTYFPITADKLFECPQKYIPLIFDDTSYSPHLNQSDKTDIHIVLHDQMARMNNDLGFSIKSKLGGSSTLINSNKDGSNFIFQIDGISDSQMRHINSLDKFKQKFDYIREVGGTWRFVKVAGETLRNNLTMLDLGMSRIIAACLEKYYTGKGSDLSEVCKLVAHEDPLHIKSNEGQPMYAYKLKQCLLAFALGMTVSSPWYGKFNANGGYIVVKEDGDVICYHFFDRNDLEDYLFNNTKFDTPSTSRHEFGEVYKVHDNFFIKLNIQVRFK